MAPLGKEHLFDRQQIRSARKVCPKLLYASSSQQSGDHEPTDDIFHREKDADLGGWSRRGCRHHPIRVRRASTKLSARA
jgi:hypothetical protein